MESVFFRSDGAISTPFLPGSRLNIICEPSSISAEDVAEAVSAVCVCRIGRMKEAEKSLCLSCMQSFKDCEDDFGSPQEQLDWEAQQTGEFDSPKVPRWRCDVWKLVRFTTIRVEKMTQSGSEQTMVSLLADCAWDGEHGVSLHYEGGKKVDQDGDVGLWGIEPRQCAKPKANAFGRKRLQ